MNETFLFDDTMREIFEYPDPSIPFIVWTGDFRTFMNHMIECHWHNEFEYSVLVCGELDYFIDGKHIRMREGDVVFINANTMHMAIPVEKNDNVVMFTVSFLPCLFNAGNDNTMFRKYFQPMLQSSIRGFLIDQETLEGGNIAKLLNEIHKLDCEEREHYELLGVGLISKIWSLTLSYVKEHKHEFISFELRDKNKDKARDVMLYIHKHYAENIRVDDIARSTGISRSECFRSFQRYTNRNPMEYLTEYRLAHAVNLLRETNKSITQIAMECGFSNSSYFGKIFKKKYDLTPSEFKNSYSKIGLKKDGVKK